MKRSRIIVTAALLLRCVACDAPGPASVPVRSSVAPPPSAAPPSAAAAPPPRATPVGSWETACVSKAKTRIRYDEALALLGTYTFYADGGCTLATSVNTWTGHAELGEDQPGARRITVHFDSFRSLPLVEAGVASMNANAYCGFKDWTMGAERDVLGLKCYGFSIPKGGQSLDIFAVSGSKLRFGKGSKIIASPKESDRPTELSEGGAFERSSGL